MIGAQHNLCVKEIKVKQPLHLDSLTLSALVVRTQWYEDSSRLRTTSAALDGYDVFRALSYPTLSTKRLQIRLSWPLDHSS